jgi:hypothetical protein
MKACLSYVNSELYHFLNGKTISGAHASIRGNVTGIRGDVTGICGNVTWIRGDVTGICGDVTWTRGNVTGIRGNVNEAELTPDERLNGVDIKSLILH